MDMGGGKGGCREGWGELEWGASADAKAGTPEKH